MIARFKNFNHHIAVWLSSLTRRKQRQVEKSTLGAQKRSQWGNANGERGSVLWFIMIAIVLLGAITIVISRGGSTVDQSGDIEQIRIRSGQIMRYARSIESAIQDMRLRGVSENEISFENADTATDYTNADCDAAADPNFPDCLLFDVQGAGLSYNPPPSGTNDGSDWIFSSANNVGSAADPVGTTLARSGNDLVMLLPNANTALCIQINRELNVGTPGTLPTDTAGIDDTAFTGAYPNVLTIIDADPGLELDGQNAGCFIDANDSNKVYFYYVLLAR